MNLLNLKSITCCIGGSINGVSDWNDIGPVSFETKYLELFVRGPTYPESPAISRLEILDPTGVVCVVYGFPVSAAHKISCKFSPKEDSHAYSVVIEQQVCPELVAAQLNPEYKFSF
ncbi:MAG: hypothetical protein FJ161_04490 [Gammaproteobacteria bacterium]|nr:hypothetical protein [Gammaproteobacteria bacterium]